MGWKLKILFDDGSEDLIDEVFDSEEAAQAEYDEWLEGWSAGRDVLRLAGREYSDKNIEDCEIWEE